MDAERQMRLNRGWQLKKTCSSLYTSTIDGIYGFQVAVVRGYPESKVQPLFWSADGMIDPEEFCP